MWQLYAIKSWPFWVRFLSLAWSKLKICSANHRPFCWSKLSCDWRSTAWFYSEQETEWPWSMRGSSLMQPWRRLRHWLRNVITGALISPGRNDLFSMNEWTAALSSTGKVRSFKSLLTYRGIKYTFTESKWKFVLKSGYIPPRDSTRSHNENHVSFCAP